MGLGDKDIEIYQRLTLQSWAHLLFGPKFSHLYTETVLLDSLGPS